MSIDVQEIENSEFMEANIKRFCNFVLRRASYMRDFANIKNNLRQHFDTVNGFLRGMSDISNGKEAIAAADPKLIELITALLDICRATIDTQVRAYYANYGIERYGEAVGGIPTPGKTRFSSMDIGTLATQLLYAALTSINDEKF